MKPTEVFDHLSRKLKILDEIKVNTEKQCRFARKGEMRGLRRLLNERAALVDELLRLNREPVGDYNKIVYPGLKQLLEEIAARKLEILDCCNSALREARAARERVGAKLYDVRVGRRLHHQYVNCWAIPVQGSRFNKRG